MSCAFEVKQAQLNDFDSFQIKFESETLLWHIFSTVAIELKMQYVV